MANEIRTKLDAWQAATIAQLQGLASNSGCQSGMINNPNRRPACLVMLKLTLAVAPTNGTVLELFLIRSDSSGNRTDNAAPTNGPITLQNARMIGALQVNGTVGPFTEVFDTAPLGPLSDPYGFIVRNSTNQALAATGQILNFATYLPEIQ